MKQQRKRGGFTLIEIALAILVVSIGLLSVFSLFPSGMAANKHAIDDTYGAMFADEVFNGLRAVLSTNSFQNVDWSNVAIPARSSEKWGFVNEQIVRANRLNDWQLAQYRPSSLDGALDFAVRYKLELQPINANIAYAILEVLPGEFGPTNNVLRVYTELYNTRLN
jgi:prepilin-type N-terminal cleavage/methylation domain-containing protein